MKAINIISTLIIILASTIPAYSQKNIEKVLARVEKEPKITFSRQVTRNPNTHKIIGEQRSYILKDDKYNSALRSAIEQDERQATQVSMSQGKYFSLVFNKDGLTTTYSIVLRTKQLTVSVYTEQQRGSRLSYYDSSSDTENYLISDNIPDNQTIIQSDDTTIIIDYDGNYTINQRNSTTTPSKSKKKAKKGRKNKKTVKNVRVYNTSTSVSSSTTSHSI